jgi:hypothetical protein
MKPTIAFLAALTGLLGPADAAPQTRDPAQQPTGARVAELLAQAAREGSGGEELVLALVALGEAALPHEFSALAQGRVLEDELGEVLIELGRPQIQATLEAITRLPHAHVCGFLADQARPETGVRERVAALLVLAQTARSRDLDLCLALAGEGGAADRGLRSQLERTLLALVARDPLAISALATRFAAQPEACYAAIIRAIGSADSPQALRLCSEQLGQAPPADALLLCEIARLGAVVPHPIEARVRTRVREYLRQSDPQLLAAAVYAVGRLDDGDAAEPLVELLQNDYEHVRASAHRVLRGLAGEPLPPEHERWALWYRRESEWWRRDAPFHKAELGSGAQFQVAAALRVLATHRLYRHAIAPEVARCLARPERDIVMLACAALGQLGSRTALPELVDLLARGEPASADAARRALERITGERLGDEADAWRRLLQ